MRALIDVSFRNGLAIVISRETNRLYSRSVPRDRGRQLRAFLTASVAARADRTVRASVTCGQGAPAPRANRFRRR